MLEEPAGVYRALNSSKRRIGTRLGQLRVGLGGDKASELAERARCMLIEDAARGAAWDAMTLAGRLLSLLVDVSGHWSMLTQEDVEGLRALLPEIRDEGLARLVERLSGEIERMGALNARRLAEVSQLFGLAAPVDEPGREELWRRLAEYDAAFATWKRDAMIVTWKCDARFEELRKEVQLPRYLGGAWRLLRCALLVAALGSVARVRSAPPALEPLASVTVVPD